MRVLITNRDLATRGGTQTYVRDLASGLLKRGHTPVVYSFAHGDVARELRARTVPVVDDLEHLPRPDIIHGNEHMSMMTALLRFQGVPALFFCHGWLGWGAAPPRFPRIRRFVAVDHTCRDRLIHEHGIQEEQVRTIFNFVDLDRFRPRDPLPRAPRRALLFSNYEMKRQHVSALREACAQANLKLDVIGEGTGNASHAPESLLGGYDLVFAKGKSAIESLAVGAAVVICGVELMGPLVTTAEFERLRNLNFGIRALHEPISVEALLREIGRYDASDAAEVSRRTRLVAAGEPALDEIVELYDEVVAEQSGAACDPEEEGRAAAAYLRYLQAEIVAHGAASMRLQNRLRSVPVIGKLAVSLLRQVAGRARS